MGPPYGKLPILFPYHSHIFRDSYGSGMGIVWEAYHKGVPLLGVPGISIEVGLFEKKLPQNHRKRYTDELSRAWGSCLCHRNNTQI